MLKPRYTRRTFYVDVPDEQAIATIMARYGLSTASDAIRFSVRLIAESPQVQLPAKKKAQAR